MEPNREEKKWDPVPDFPGSAQGGHVCPFFASERPLWNQEFAWYSILSLIILDNVIFVYKSTIDIW